MKKKWLFLLGLVAFLSLYTCLHYPKGPFACCWLAQKIEKVTKPKKTQLVSPPQDKKSAKSQAQPSSPLFTLEEEKAIHKIIHQYLRENPKILMELGELIQEQNKEEERQQVERSKEKIAKSWKQLTNDKAFEVLNFGERKNLVLIEFTQPLCPSCKRSYSLVETFLKKHQEVQHIVFYWPFFGGESVYLSRLVLAAKEQGKMEKVEKMVWEMTGAGNYDKDALLKKLETIPDLNVKRLLKDADGKKVTKAIKNNFYTAKHLEFLGTPVLILMNRTSHKFILVPNFLEILNEELEAAVQKVK